MKPLAVIIFHKNVNSYPARWIAKCVDSINEQTFQDFDVLELDYGGGKNRIYRGSNWESKKMADHAQAHNYLLKKSAYLGYEATANVNVDDYYSSLRFETQLPYVGQYDVISSNFYQIDSEGNIRRKQRMHDKDIMREARHGHNIIAHPVLMYSKNFCQDNEGLRPSEIPYDDFNLWKRSFGRFSFVILPDYLFYYRIHEMKVGAQK